MWKIFKLIFLIILFSSCKKREERIIISGKLFDPNQNIAIQDANVKLSAQKVESGIYCINYYSIGTTYTDNSGEFLFSFDVGYYTNYRLEFFKDRYFESTVYINSDDITAGKSYYETYYLYPEGFLNIHIKNNTPFDSSDNMSYKLMNGTLNCADCCLDSTHIFKGENIDTINICKLYGHQNIGIQWFVMKNNILHCFSDTVFCTAFDTTFFEILY